MNKNPAKEIVIGDDLHQRISSGVQQLYWVAKACYGPAAGVALIEPPYGEPMASRDGVTNLQKVFLADPVENMAARIVVQASKKNNQHVGDGTTAVAILAFHLYWDARRMIGSGFNRMEVARMLEDSEIKAQDELDKLSVEATPELLQDVAIIAAGDEALGALIADAIEEVGPEGGVVIEDFAGTGLYAEMITGFYFQKGFTNVNLTNNPSDLESRYDNVAILITDKTLSTASDVGTILDKVVEAGIRDLIIVGDVLDEAQGAMMLMRLQGEITCTVVGIPPVLGGKSLFLDDLALVTGGKVFAPGASGEHFALEMLGAAERVVVTGNTTTIVGREGDHKDIARRISSLREQLQKATHPTDREALKSRMDRLLGRLVLIRVGGATEIEQKAVKLQVDDAVRAVQAASKGGIVPGGGVALYVAGNLRAHKELYEDLLENAGVTGAPVPSVVNPWHGLDLRDGGDKAVDLKKAGVVDPTLVVKETLKNATSVVKILITANVGVAYVDRSNSM